MSADQNDSRPHVVIAGGGIAGLETLIALRELAGDRVGMTLVAPEPDFVYRPLHVEEPFTHEPAEQHELGPIAEEFEARLLRRAIAKVEPDAHQIELDDGSSVGYDAAVICVGARNVSRYSRAITFRSGRDLAHLDAVLSNLEAGEGPRRIAFVVPPGNSWPLPIYELALMTQRRVRERGLKNVTMTVFTPEQAPLILFGTVASEAVSELLRGRGIEVRTGVRASEAADGGLELHPGGERVADAAILALPELEGPGIAGLPADGDGFIPIDDQARVKGATDVWAAGDGTNFPIKQGGLGTQQADAAAEDIAARFGADLEPRPFHPVLRGMLLTGDESLRMSHSLTGGEGEGRASPDNLWWPPHKVSGRYLAPWLAGTSSPEPEPPSRPIEVEVALPREWHTEPMALDPYEAPPG